MGIYVNQIGYLTNSEKVAVSTSACNFQVIRTSDQKCVFDGVASNTGMDASSNDNIWQIDFSALKESGTYYILSGKGEKSPVFSIGQNIYDSLKNDVMKP